MATVGGAYMDGETLVEAHILPHHALPIIHFHVISHRALCHPIMHLTHSALANYAHPSMHAHALFHNALPIREAWLQQTLNMSFNATAYNMLNVRETAMTQDINMCVQPVHLHLHPNKQQF